MAESGKVMTTKVVDNFTTFPTSIYTPLSDGQNKSYSDRKKRNRRSFQQTADNRFCFEIVIKIHFGAELIE